MINITLRIKLRRQIIKIQVLLIFLSGIIFGILIYSNKQSYERSVRDKSSEELNEWGEYFKIAEIKSSIDNNVQQVYFYIPDTKEKVPLIVSLHHWRANYKDYDPISKISYDSKYAYIYPDFRGKMNSPDSCCSDLVISDIDDAIDFALKSGRIDNKRLFLIGLSGGAYTALCSYARSKHLFKKVISWLPVTDLAAWYKENMKRKETYYAKDILACTDSTDDVLNIKEAHSRSPLYFELPIKKYENTILDIYAAVYDGTFNNGTVPVTQSAYYYNKILKDKGVKDNNSLISDEELLDLFKMNPPSKNFGEINDRQIYLRKSSGPVNITFFGEGHNFFPAEYIFQLLKNEY